MESCGGLFEKPHLIIKQEKTEIDMALNLKMIENLLIKEKGKSNLASIIWKYAALKQKLDDTNNQSWYFKKGIESYEQTLVDLANDYEEIRGLFNETTADHFINEINKNNAYISNFDKNAMNAVAYMGFGLMRNKNRFYKELIGLKNKTDVLMSMDYYLQNPEAFLNIIE